MKISIIMTVFNGDKYLEQSINSFLQQKFIEKELIIVDDISTDKSHQIIDSFCKLFPLQIKWIRQKDQGISHARNIALNHCTGDLIGFLGCDDLLYPDFFENAQYFFNISPNYDVIYFNNYCVGNSFSFNLASSIMVNKRNLIKYCPIASGESFYYKKTIFDKFKFNEHNKFSMDYELNLAIASSNADKKFNFFPVNLTAVINQDTGFNQSSLNSLNQRIESILVQLKYANCFLQKLKILYRSKKLILKNLLIFKKTFTYYE